MTRKVVLFVLFGLARAGAMAAQEGTTCGSTTSAAEQSVPRFVECARAATGKYRDESAAILDGYRRIGRDFPAMGEHWIRIGLVFDGKFDPARPEVLNYVTVAGKPRLIGVAYAVPLLPGREPPSPNASAAVESP